MLIPSGEGEGMVNSQLVTQGNFNSPSHGLAVVVKKRIPTTRGSASRGKTYNAQFHQEPSKNSAKLLGQPSAWTLTCQNWTWTAGPLKKVQRFYPTIQGFEDRSKIPSQGDCPCKKSKLSYSESN